MQTILNGMQGRGKDALGRGQDGSFRRTDGIRETASTRMWANAQCDGHPPHIGGALCSTPQSLADAHY